MTHIMPLSQPNNKLFGNQKDCTCHYSLDHANIHHIDMRYIYVNSFKGWICIPCPMSFSRIVLANEIKVAVLYLDIWKVTQSKRIHQSRQCRQRSFMNSSYMQIRAVFDRCVLPRHVLRIFHRKCDHTSLKFTSCLHRSQNATGL